MHTQIEVLVHAPAARIYALAAEVEWWPAILPHYRWVTVHEHKGNARLVEMAASRDGFPVWWQAVQLLYPEVPRITFRHVRGITTGMEVEWSFHEAAGATLVRITHDLDLHWPLVGGWAAERIIGPHFVDAIAGKTLRRMKVLAEQRPRGEQQVVAGAEPHPA